MQSKLKVSDGPEAGHIVNKLSEASMHDSGVNDNSWSISGRSLTITLTMPSSLLVGLELIIYFIILIVWRKNSVRGVSFGWWSDGKQNLGSDRGVGIASKLFLR